MSVKRKLADIESVIARDPELVEAFESGQYAQRAAHLITQMREARGLTKAKLAALLDVKPPRITEAENPKGSDGPTYRFMFEVAMACGFRWPASIKDLRRLSGGASGARRSARQAAEVKR
jgi:transcriptional regulator with XRE-family HTH domain